MMKTLKAVGVLAFLVFALLMVVGAFLEPPPSRVPDDRQPAIVTPPAPVRPPFDPKVCSKARMAVARAKDGLALFQTWGVGPAGLAGRTQQERAEGITRREAEIVRLEAEQVERCRTW